MRAMTIPTALAVAIAVAVVAAAPSAQACSLLPLDQHQLDPAEQAVDTTPPDLVAVTALSVQRGQAPQPAGCGTTATSCDDVGFIHIVIAPTADDRTPPDQMGYRLELVDGAMPAGLQLPATAVRPFGDRIDLSWGDGPSDAQEAFSFRLRITAVDLAGNEGAGGLPAAATVVEIADPGSRGGCSATRGASADLAFVVLIPLALTALGAAATGWSDAGRGACRVPAKSPGPGF